MIREHLLNAFENPSERIHVSGVDFQNLSTKSPLHPQFPNSARHPLTTRNPAEIPLFLASSRPIPDFQYQRSGHNRRRPHHDQRAIL